MEKTNTKKMGTGAALVIALMSFGVFVALASIITKNQSQITAVSLADDSNDSGNSNDDGDNKDDQKDEDKNDDGDNKDDQKDEDENDDSDKKKENESVKKQAERQREDAKKQLERSNKSSENDDDSDDDSNKGEDTDGDTEDVNDVEDTEDVNGDDNGMFKDRNKTLTKLQEEIAKARENILEKRVEGADVTAALARLALAEASIAQVGSSFDANNFEAAKELAKEIKKEAHFTEKDLEFTKKSAEAIAEVSKKLTKASQKIVILESLGGDASAFKAQLSTLRADFAILQASDIVTREAFKAVKKKAERLKNLVEQSIFALGGSDGDDDLFADHEEDSDDLEDDLNDVAEIEDGDENGIAQEVKKIAREHRSSTAVIATSLGDIKNRSGFIKTVFGPDFNALESLTAQTTAMMTRADALMIVSTQVTDPDVKQILVDRAAVLRSEASKLSAYVASEGNQFSIFGKFLSFFR